MTQSTRFAYLGPKQEDDQYFAPVLTLDKLPQPTSLRSPSWIEPGWQYSSNKKETPTVPSVPKPTNQPTTQQPTTTQQQVVQVDDEEDSWWTRARTRAIEILNDRRTGAISYFLGFWLAFILSWSCNKKYGWDVFSRLLMALFSGLFSWCYVWYWFFFRFEVCTALGKMIPPGITPIEMISSALSL